MATLIFKLRNVPEDEAYEIRELLTENDIPFYETDAGNWGISMPGIWIKDEAFLSKAVQLIGEYQIQRSEKCKQEYADLTQAGQAPTLLSNLFDSPLRFIVYIFSIAVILYISVIPFMDI